MFDQIAGYVLLFDVHSPIAHGELTAICCDRSWFPEQVFATRSCSDAKKLILRFRTHCSRANNAVTCTDTDL